MDYFDCVEKKNIHMELVEGAPPVFMGASLNSEGQSYYEFRDTITTEYTCVITSDNGVVRYINADASTISPHVGERVFGIETYPADIAFDGTWIFNFETESFYQDADIVAAQTLYRNKMEYNRLLRAAGVAHMLLQLLPPDDAEAKQQELKDYLSGLQAVDLTLSDPDWPPVPEFIN